LAGDCAEFEDRDGKVVEAWLEADGGGFWHLAARPDQTSGKDEPRPVPTKLGVTVFVEVSRDRRRRQQQPLRINLKQQA
jgi:hypothetical protein